MLERGSRRWVALVAAAGCAASLSAVAKAQDSVGTSGGIPGSDALGAYTVSGTSLQVRNYAVDTATKTSSWGNEYYVGPALKASASLNASYFNHLIATSVVSNRLTPVSPLLRTSYSLWNTAGQGVHPTRNAATTGTVNAADLQGHNFGLAMLEFAGGPNAAFGDSDDENNIIAASVGFMPRQNSRLHVSRVVTAVNRPSAAAGFISDASFGLGGVDENLNVHFLADGYGMNGNDPLTTRRLYRVAAASRATNLINAISNSAAGDTAATRSLLNTTTTLTPPTVIPTSVAGRPVMLDLDMANNVRFEQTANTTVVSATNHLGAGVSARGPISFSAVPFTRLSNGAADAGVAGVLCRAPSSTKTRSISAWGVNTDGSADLTGSGLVRVDLPTDAAQLQDAEDGFNPGNVHGSLGNQEFTNYQSQVCFRGGAGPVAMAVHPVNGDLLLAAGVAATGGGAAVPQTQDNYIAVARVNAGTGAVAWGIAAHTGSSSGASSKQIWADTNGDRLPDTVIGRVARYSETFLSATNGPSISAPSMDAMGNVYFVATIELFGTPQSTRTVGLLKANLDAGTGAYQLELMLTLNDVLPGLNSLRNYQVQLLSPADSDSVDSGALWHSSVVQGLNVAVTPSSIEYGEPYALGALVFRTKIVYDHDQNGLFIDPSMPGGSGTDQAYNVVMAVVPKVLGADLAHIGGAPGPDGRLTLDDILFFVDEYNNDSSFADVAAVGGEPFPDGLRTLDDILFFIDAYNAGN